MTELIYKIELEVSEQKLSLVLEFLKGVSFIQNVRVHASNEIANPEVLESMEDFESGKSQPVSMSLTELKALQLDPGFSNPDRTL